MTEVAEATKPEDHAISNARGWLETMCEQVKRLADAENGGGKECGQCEGTGETQSASNLEPEECPVCNGHGYIEGEDADEVRREIEEGPLSIQVRDGWRTPGSESLGPEEFEILLSTGGPALRIYGKLDDYNQPEDIELQHQDWFKPWTALQLTDDQYSAVETYARQFYFGE